MNLGAKEGGRSIAHGVSLMSKTAIFVATSLTVMTALPAIVGHQDVTALEGGIVEGLGWQAALMDTPINAAAVSQIAKAANTHIGSVDVSNAGRLVRKALADELALMNQEDRISRSGKGARVFAASVRDSYLADADFSAGEIAADLEGLGSRVAGGPARIRTAFAMPAPTPQDEVLVATSFRLQGPPRFPAPDVNAKDGLMLASLGGSEAGTSALGYAPSQEDGQTNRAASLFEKVLKDQPQAFIPPIGDDDHAWAATPLSDEASSSKEQACLARGIYFEARGENTMGQAAVAQVILNRVRNPAFPNTICGVVYQNQNWRNRCQFSFACDGLKDRIADAGSYSRAQRVAEQVTKGEIWLNEVGSATHYHATYVHPRWASAMEKVDKIGKHIFYRTYNGGW